MTKIIILVVLSVALGVNAGPFRARNVEVPVDLIKEPITIELIKEETLIPVDQLKLAEEVNAQEPVALISEKILDNEENRVETLVIQETLVPLLKTEAEPEKAEAEAKPVLIEVIETVKSIPRPTETANIETIAVPIVAEQKIEILVAAEPAVKTIVTDEEEIIPELKQQSTAPVSPGVLGVVQNFIQNNPLNPVNLLNRASTSAPPKADEAAAAETEAATARPTFVQQIQDRVENLQQTIVNTLNGGAPASAADANNPSRPTLLDTFQNAINNVFRPGQAAPAAAPAAAAAAAPAATSDADAPAPAPAVAAPAAAPPAGPIQQLVSTVQNFLTPRQPAAPVAPAASATNAAVAAPAQPAEAEETSDEEKSIEKEEEPARSEDEEPAKEQ